MERAGNLGEFMHKLEATGKLDADFTEAYSSFLNSKEVERALTS